jgi:thiol:disulfide interchange protein
MGLARLAVYLVGLVLVVAAAWVFLTQTEVGESIPQSIALAVILLLVGIGVMASAKSINDRTETRRVVHEGGTVGPAPPGTIVERDPVVYEERRRFD